MLQSDGVRIEEGGEDTALLAPVPTAVEQHFDNLRLEEGVLDVPSRRQEGKTPDEHLVPSRQLKALRALTGACKVRLVSYM